jgi:hypothetical protein
MTFLTIENGQFVAYDNADHQTVISTAQELEVLLRRDEDISRSSSLDFPEEYTTDPIVLALVTYLNGLEDDPEWNEEPKDFCPRCEEFAVLSADKEAGVTFDVALCDECRRVVIQELSMDDFDDAYERARANGWAD